MGLTYLYYFKVIAETENMSRAAEALHVSQPALSKTISKLESELGVTLFERRRGRISLSPIGSDFYRQVSRAFDCIDEGHRLIERYKRSAGSSVAIGAPVGELMNTLLFDYLRGSGDSPPQISQYVYSPEALEEQLLGGHLDFALTPIPLNSPEIQQIKLMDEEILLVVGHQHPLSDKRIVALADCAGERFIVNDASFDRRAVTDNCKLAGFTPNITLCSNEPGIISEALENGHGVSMVPCNVFYEKYQADGPVRALRFSDVEVFRFISIVSRRDRMLMEAARRLYQYAVDYFRRYGQTLKAFTDSYFPQTDFGPRKGIGLNSEDIIGSVDPTGRSSLPDVLL